MENIPSIYVDRFSRRDVTRPYNKVALSHIDAFVAKHECDRINSSTRNTFDSLDFTTVRIKALIYFTRNIRAIEFDK